MILSGTLSEYYSYSVFGMILAGIFCWNKLLVFYIYLTCSESISSTDNQAIGYYRKTD